MREATEELSVLQHLLDSSHSGATEHLRAIITDDRTLRARKIADLMTGMRVLSFATVTAKGRQIRARPAVSAAGVEGEEVAVSTHGQVEILTPQHPDRDEVLRHWIEHYGASALPWDDIMLMRIRPTWMVGYAFARGTVLAARGVEPDVRPER